MQNIGKMFTLRLIFGNEGVFPLFATICMKFLKFYCRRIRKLVTHLRNRVFVEFVCYGRMLLCLVKHDEGNFWCIVVFYSVSMGVLTSRMCRPAPTECNPRFDAAPHLTQWSDQSRNNLLNF